MFVHKSWSLGMSPKDANRHTSRDKRGDSDVYPWRFRHVLYGRWRQIEYITKGKVRVQEDGSESNNRVRNKESPTKMGSPEHEDRRTNIALWDVSRLYGRVPTWGYDRSTLQEGPCTESGVHLANFFYLWVLSLVGVGVYRRNVNLLKEFEESHKIYTGKKWRPHLYHLTPISPLQYRVRSLPEPPSCFPFLLPERRYL